MNRRSFIKFLLSVPITTELDIEKLLWIPKPIITVPTLPVSLYGIPYHLNAFPGTWLGFERSIIPWNWKRDSSENYTPIELVDLIKILERNRPS